MLLIVLLLLLVVVCCCSLLSSSCCCRRLLHCSSLAGSAGQSPSQYSLLCSSPLPLPGVVNPLCRFQSAPAAPRGARARRSRRHPREPRPQPRGLEGPGGAARVPARVRPRQGARGARSRAHTHSSCVCLDSCTVLHGPVTLCVTAAIPQTSLHQPSSPELSLHRRRSDGQGQGAEGG